MKKWEGELRAPIAGDEPRRDGTSRHLLQFSHAFGVLVYFSGLFPANSRGKSIIPCLIRKISSVSPL
ncbi:MAG: hypothetical protein ABI042_02590, partial [Verrucomicrobiota bacterium]